MKSMRRMAVYRLAIYRRLQPLSSYDHHCSNFTTLVIRYRITPAGIVRSQPFWVSSLSPPRVEKPLFPDEQMGERNGQFQSSTTAGNVPGYR